MASTPSGYSPQNSLISSVCSTVMSLRDFALALGLPAVPNVSALIPSDPRERRKRGLRQLLVRTLDSTVVGIPLAPNKAASAPLVTPTRSSTYSDHPATALNNDKKRMAFRQAVFGSTSHDPSMYERQQYLRDLVPRAILNILRREQQQGISWKDRNVLSRGYEARRHGDDLGTASNSNLIPKFPNTLVNHLLTRPWEELHAYCGDTVMFYLLTRTLMFLRVDNGSLVQLTGMPLHALVEQQTNQNGTGYFCPGNRRSSGLKRADTLKTPPQHHSASRIFYVRNCPSSPGL